MVKKILVYGLLFLLTGMISAPTVQAQTITGFDTRVMDYQLPYPGLLPDNPLYLIKSLRNSVLLLVTTDDLEKAKIMLNLSDKRMAMAKPLADKGKLSMSVESVIEAEELFERMLPVVAKIEDQNKRSEFLIEIKKANLKHREEIETLMKEIPQGEIEELQKLIEKNIEIEKQISAIK